MKKILLIILISTNTLFGVCCWVRCEPTVQSNTASVTQNYETQFIRINQTVNNISNEYSNYLKNIKETNNKLNEQKKLKIELLVELRKLLKSKKELENNVYQDK